MTAADQPRGNVTLSRLQELLLLDMQKGAVIHYMSGMSSYFFRASSHKKCTQQALALRDRKLAIIGGAYGREKLVLTKAGMEWVPGIAPVTDKET